MSHTWWQEKQAKSAFLEERERRQVSLPAHAPVPESFPFSFFLFSASRVVAGPRHCLPSPKCSKCPYKYGMCESFLLELLMRPESERRQAGRCVFVLVPSRVETREEQAPVPCTAKEGFYPEEEGGRCGGRHKKMGGFRGTSHCHIELHKLPLPTGLRRDSMKVFFLLEHASSVGGIFLQAV